MSFINNKKKRILIMAAGTGGHIFSGLAVADTMRARGWQISWLGTTHGMECDLTSHYNIEIDTIKFSGLRGKGLIHMLKGIWQILISFNRCFIILKQRKPHLVLGVGGYATVPGGIIARLLAIPLVLINADTTLLLSNKLLSPIAQKILFGFEISSSVSIRKSEITGNPLRKEILAISSLPTERYANRNGVLRILIIGGSLGSMALNECVPAAVAKLPLYQRPIIVHQSGKQHIQELYTAYLRVQVKAKVINFIDNMWHHYVEADIVICRAGAITISELMAIGVASILVPLIISTTSHQYNNADWMAKCNAAIHLPQIKMTPENLAALLQKLDRLTCAKLAESAYKVGRRNANAKIATALEKLLA